uniref:coiled-coil domain-containing protein 89 isoform X1 n=1 Tax=Solea senegalensis TaxID=28829 RepID=UPI001CD8DBC4|nr:coiled-coil domain-containing protein 89 isoform X1 [Solea senegalensis]
MTTPQRNDDNFMKSTEHMDSVQRSMDKLLNLSAVDMTETEILRSRMDEQSSLICILKQRADELLCQYQASEKMNTELKDRINVSQKELDTKSKRAELLEMRFMDLAANNQSVIAFMNEYKNHNAQLKMENKRLQSENDTLFSQKVQDKEVIVQNLMQEIKLMTENYTNKEKEYGEKLAECQSRLLDEATRHQAKEASLLDQVQDSEQKQREAVGMSKDMKRKLERAEEKFALKETDMRNSIAHITEEKEKLLSLSIERGRVIQVIKFVPFTKTPNESEYLCTYKLVLIQEKQEEIQQLTRKLKEKKSHSEPDNGFGEAADLDVKVKLLQCALRESNTNYEKLKKDFEAFKGHSANLLTRERELNKKLRQMMG